MDRFLRDYNEHVGDETENRICFELLEYAVSTSEAGIYVPKWNGWLE